MLKTLGVIFGVVFVLVAILGFISSPVLGLFEVNTAHNLFHLVSGILFLYFALANTKGLGGFFKVFGIIYLVLAVIGFLFYPEGGLILGLFEGNPADHYLHLVLGVVIAAIGFGMKGDDMMM